MEIRNIKVCVYLEFYHFLGGFFFKKIGTGLLSSYQNQKKVLDEMSITYSETWDDSCTVLQLNAPWLWSLYLIGNARSKNKKIIIWSHITHEDIKGVFRFSNVLSFFAKRYFAYLYKLADVVFSPTDYTKGILIRYGVFAEKIVVVSNGVDIHTFVADSYRRELIRKQYGLTRQTIGTVGLAIPRKGIDSFVSLARVFTKNDFVWFGKMYSPLIARPLPKDIPSNVLFSGYVNDIVGAYSALDIFIFPSYEENQGMAILEAASMGLPLIVRDIPAYNGWLIHGENCLKAKSNSEFESCISRLTNDDSLREHLKINSKILARENSLHEIGVKTLEVYSSL